MKKHWMLVVIMLLIAVLLGGCGEPISGQPVFPSVAGKKNISEAVQALDEHRSNVLPFRARGDMKYTGFEGGKKFGPESFNSILIFIPPTRLYFKASSVLGEAVWLGSNDEEFWLRMKPKEVSLYWWGKWAKLSDCPSQLLLSPESVLDGLGMVRVDSDWMLLDEGGRDVLLRLDDKGRFFKRIYINRRGYLVEKIEYYDENGFVGVLLELSDYNVIDGGSPVPMKIRITSSDRGVVTGKVEIKLRNPKAVDPAMIKKKVFERPPATGLKYIYELGDDCNYIPHEVN